MNESMVSIKSGSQWCYRGEGNATLVICNPETRKVLRLRKAEVNPKSAKTSQEFTRQELARSIDFCKDIFVPLLGEKYVYAGTIVDLPRGFLNDVKTLVTSANEERPLYRLKKEVRADCKCAVLMPDLCFVSDSSNNNLEEVNAMPNFCIEIKPKCGLLPSCVDHDGQTSAYGNVKASVCKYCLFQWQKVNRERKYHRRSEYCPLDLFSMDSARVLYALKCLLRDPQNNLRIFRDGKLVYSGETNLPPDGEAPPTNKTPLGTDSNTDHDRLLLLENTLRSSFGSGMHHAFHNGSLLGEINGKIFYHINMFLAIILQVLVDDSKESTTDDCLPFSNSPVCAASKSKFSAGFMNDKMQSFLKSSGIAFSNGGVLNEILNAQKLDRMGSDAVFKIYEEMSKSCCISEVLHSSTFALSYRDSKTDDILTKPVTLRYFDECLLPPKVSEAKKGDATSISPGLDDIARFLIAACANDCSIMISFQQVEEVPSDAPGHHIREAITGFHFKYSIAVIDLDPKNMKRIPKYYHEYHQIVDSYLLFQKK